jgi:L-asparaginase II
MRLAGGWIAKGGAEGLFCAAAPDGRGLALKCEDGAYRAIRPALARVLGIDEFDRVPVESSRGDVVGEMVLA